MSFASLTFLYFFLPITLFGYCILPHKARNIFLLIANIVFYGWGEPSFLIVILLTTVINFYAGKIMLSKPKYKKHAAIIAILIDLALLFVFKYTTFFLDILRPIVFWTELPYVEIGLPLGISFYTFQVLSYIIDVYCGDVGVQQKFTRFATYMTLFPQLIAGPIVRYRDLADQLEDRKQSVNKFGEGVIQLLVGLSKKVLLANNMGALWEALKLSPSTNGVLGAWVGALAFTLQIYFDFSGYSDMACGLGKMFGFELPINFNYPYISKSITEFWRRWHISLSTWFRDYVYISLGGSRQGKFKTIRNLFAVWFLTGLWHGASWNFVIWGLYYFVLQVIEKVWLLKQLEKLPKFISHIYTMLFVIIGWVIFAFDDFKQLGLYFKALFISENGIISHHAMVLCISYLPLIIISIFACLPLGKQLFSKIIDTKTGSVITAVLCIGAVMLCTASLVAQSYNPFLYFRF